MVERRRDPHPSPTNERPLNVRRRKADLAARVNGNLPLEFDDVVLTSYAGLELFARYLRRIDFNRVVRHAFADLPAWGDFGVVAMVRVVIGLVVVGGRRLRMWRTSPTTTQANWLTPNKSNAGARYSGIYRDIVGFWACFGVFAPHVRPESPALLLFGVTFHRSRDTIVTCRVRLRFASSTRPAPARSSTRESGSIGPRRQRLRQILSSLPAIPLQRFPQMVHKGPLNTLFQRGQNRPPPPRQSPKGGNRGTKVLNTVGPRRLAKPQQTPGCVPHPSRFVPHPKTFVRAEGQRRAHAPRRCRAGRPRRASLKSGPPNAARETISATQRAASSRTPLVSSGLLPRPQKSPHIQRENGGEPRSDPGVRAPTRRGGGGGSLEQTRLATNLGECPQAVEPTACYVRTNDRSGVHRDGWIPDPVGPNDFRGGPITTSTAPTPRSTPPRSAAGTAEPIAVIPARA